MSIPKGWDGFVDALRPQWESNPITNELMKITNDKDLSVTLWGCLNRQAVDWLHEIVPALKNKRPIDMLNDQEGRESIMLILISNPWW